ncbi:BTB/POZ domain-containing protein 6-like [Ruditapes philippinarum]|uniref:BTB/POZ domain-containing protein 6-like n=1 Tax=Ruditapes philippinarum TaxID=129788 RepID=UPI00295BA4C1|nr:BTB/POZ domain-containing protein 6-like [Ruditapes philippinarum]XP_060574091.1 BTB/POZ domain-containing protein 6-like [Ruditapes philippinarum]
MAEGGPALGWQDDKTLSEACRYMLTSRFAADVEFSVGNQQEIVKAHKFILVCRSSVFQAMFTNDFADNRETIKIPDIELEIFEKLLTFLYTDETEITGDNVLPLLYAAKKYSVNKLVRKCLEFLDKGRSPENICDILEQAHFYNENDFREKSVRYILDNAKSVLGDSTFLELCQDCVKMIITYDELQADERTVLEAVTSWGEHQCQKQNLEKNHVNLRSVLGDILYLVRFPLLGETYFTNVVSETALLNDAEKVELFKYFYKPGYKTETFISRNRYATNDTPKYTATPTKKTEYRNIQTCLRFNRVCEDGSWYCGGEPDAITFTTNQNLWIHGVLVYGTYIGEGNYDVTCSINDSSETEMIQVRKQIKTVEHQLTYEVLFEEEIQIQRDKRYSVLVKLTNPYGIDTYQGLDGSASVTVGNVKFNFSKSKNSRNGTDVKIGQIPGLLFSTLE